MTDKEILYFPWWTRLISVFQTFGNDGLTNAERSHLARQWRREVMRPLTKAERDAIVDWKRKRESHGSGR